MIDKNHGLLGNIAAQMAAWQRAESETIEEKRMDAIGQNGNDGEHYLHLPTDLPTSSPTPNMVDHPPHYTSHPSGVECIELNEDLNYCLGNAVKYCFRGDNKVQSAGTEDLKKAEWYARRELERLSTRHSISSIGFGERKEQINWKITDASANKEWIYDIAVFFAQKTSVHTHDGAGDICFCKTIENGCIAQGRKSQEQCTYKSNLGVTDRKCSPQSFSRNGAFRGSTMVSQTDFETSDFCEIQHQISCKNGGKNWCIEKSGATYPRREKLAAYIAAEPEQWRKRAVFYLIAGHVEKALWYIEREIKRRKAQ